MQNINIGLEKEHIGLNIDISKKLQCIEPQEGLERKKKEIKILSGFFPVFIYFSVENHAFIKEIQKLILQILQDTETCLDEVKEKHITLTKTINILESEVSSLHKQIQKSLKNRIILPIVLLFKKVRILSSFVCLQVQKITHLKLLNLTEIIGQTIKEPYFQNPIYHISLYKLQKEPSEDLKQKIDDIKMTQKTAMLLQDLYMSAGIKKIKFSIK